MIHDRDNFSALLRQMADDLDAGSFSAIVVVVSGTETDPGISMISYGDGTSAGELLASALSGKGNNNGQ